MRRTMNNMIKRTILIICGITSMSVNSETMTMNIKSALDVIVPIDWVIEVGSRIEMDEVQWTVGGHWKDIINDIGRGHNYTIDDDNKEKRLIVSARNKDRVTTLNQLIGGDDNYKRAISELDQQHEKITNQINVNFRRALDNKSTTQTATIARGLEKILNVGTLIDNKIKNGNNKQIEIAGLIKEYNLKDEIAREKFEREVKRLMKERDALV